MASRLREDGGRWLPSVGGLTTALLPVLEKEGGTWVAWAEKKADELPELGYPENNPRFSVQRLYLSKQELMSYYGFSNRVLWPLCHYFMAPMEHRPEFFRGYAAVNQKFARRALEAHHKRDLIWIQDYQLMLVPQLIRGGNQNAFPGIVTCLLLNPFPRATVAVGSMEPA